VRLDVKATSICTAGHSDGGRSDHASAKPRPTQRGADSNKFASCAIVAHRCLDVLAREFERLCTVAGFAPGQNFLPLRLLEPPPADFS